MLLHPPVFSKSLQTCRCVALGALTHSGTRNPRYATICSTKTATCHFGRAFDPYTFAIYATTMTAIASSVQCHDGKL